MAIVFHTCTWNWNVYKAFVFQILICRSSVKDIKVLRWKHYVLWSGKTRHMSQRVKLQNKGNYNSNVFFIFIAFKGTKWAVFEKGFILCYTRKVEKRYWKGSVVSTGIRTPDLWVAKRTIYHWASWLADEWT